MIVFKKIPKANAAISPRIDSPSPVTAMPPPVCCEGWRLICDKPTQEKTIPRMLSNGPQQIQPPVNPSRPKMSPATAILFVAGGAADPAGEADGGAAGTGGDAA